MRLSVSVLSYGLSSCLIATVKKHSFQFHGISHFAYSEAWCRTTCRSRQLHVFYRSIRGTVWCLPLAFRLFNYSSTFDWGHVDRTSKQGAQKVTGRFPLCVGPSSLDVWSVDCGLHARVCSTPQVYRRHERLLESHYLEVVPPYWESIASCFGFIYDDVVSFSFPLEIPKSC